MRILFPLERPIPEKVEPQVDTEVATLYEVVPVLEAVTLQAAVPALLWKTHFPQ